MEIEDLLVKISSILDKLQIPYAITGGMAVSVWGRPRYTHDIDIIVKLVSKNIRVLAKELLDVDKDVYVSEETIKQALENGGEFNFIHPASGLKVDFWVVDNKSDKKEIERGIRKEIENCKINFVSPEDLILSKLVWYEMSQSTRQLEDIESVLRISKVDLKFVKDLAKKQGTIKILEKLLKKFPNLKI